MENEHKASAIGIGDTVMFVLARHHIEKTGNSNNGCPESPAVVVHVFSQDLVNLRVLCDGPETLWVTSATRGWGPGNWYPKSMARPVDPLRAVA